MRAALRNCGRQNQCPALTAPLLITATDKTEKKTACSNSNLKHLEKEKN